MPGLAELAFANAVESIRHARDAVAAAVVGHVSPEDVEVVRLLTSELVSNSYRHGRGTIRLSVTRVGDIVSITVCDEGDGEVRIREADSRPGGHGLRLLEKLSSGWERLDGDGTQVRFWLPAISDPVRTNRLSQAFD